MTDFLTIQLCGSFQISGEAQRDFTPRGAKTRALIAMLATCQTRRRGRRWIEAHLWSTRSCEQSKNSLRQALVEIRKQWENRANYLGADRRSVWLVADRIQVITDPVRGDFLEDLFINDPSFDDWKTQQSNLLKTKTIEMKDEDTGILQPLLIKCETDLDSSLPAGVLSDMIAQKVGSAIAETLRVTQVDCSSNRIGPGLRVTANVMKDGSGHIGLIRIVMPSTGRVIFSRTVQSKGTVSELLDSPELKSLSCDAVAHVAQNCPKISRKARVATRSTLLNTLLNGGDAPEASKGRIVNAR